MRNFYLSERSTVYATNCAVATSHPLSTSTAINTMKQGGNAIDAAVGVAFALAVTQPNAGNLGGGGFMVIRFNNGYVTTIFSASNYGCYDNKGAVFRIDNKKLDVEFIFLQHNNIDDNKTYKYSLGNYIKNNYFSINEHY